MLIGIDLFIFRLWFANYHQQDVVDTTPHRQTIMDDGGMMPNASLMLLIPPKTCTPPWEHNFNTIQSTLLHSNIHFQSKTKQASNLYEDYTIWAGLKTLMDEKQILILPT